MNTYKNSQKHKHKYKFEGEYLFQCLVICAHTFSEGDSKGIQLVGLMSFVDIGQWNTKSKPAQISHLG